MRDHKMDYIKGILVLGMVLCHVLQFFVPLGQYPLTEKITWYINAVTFSGFVFVFGYTNAISYYRKPFDSVYKKMLVNGLRLLLAFYISGIAFVVFVENKVLNLDTIVPILTLKHVPGWSEFIVSFAGYMLVGCIGFYGFRWLMTKPNRLLVAAVLLLLTTFMPYEWVTFNPLGVLIGTRQFASFPVIQYMPFYLVGIYFYKKKVGLSISALIISMVMTGLGLLFVFMNNMALPERFPPSIYWILLPGLFIYLYFVIGRYLAAQYEGRDFLSAIGRNSMFYLLVSNIIIFGLSGTRAFRPLKPFEGFGLTLIVFGVIYLLLNFGTVIRVPKEKMHSI